MSKNEEKKDKTQIRYTGCSECRGCGFGSCGSSHENNEHRHGDCGHEGHSHDHIMSPEEQKKEFIKLIVSVVLFGACFILDKIFHFAEINEGPESWVLPFVCYFVVYIVAAHNILKEAAEGIRNGKMFDENLLMAVASIGAFALAIYKGAIGEEPDGFEEGCAVIVFYNIGEFFQNWAVARSKRSVSAMLDLRPTTAGVTDEDGTIIQKNPNDVKVGETILVAGGEKVALDGICLDNGAVLDLRILNGNPNLMAVKKGMEIPSGAVNAGAPVKIRVSRQYAESTVSKILGLVEHASEKKAPVEQFITRFARIYTPVVVFAALAAAIIPPVTGLIFRATPGPGFFGDLSWSTWIYRGLNFLVVSCPCALVISIPLSFVVGMGTASKCSVLVKGAEYMELTAKSKLFIFNKNGTLMSSQPDCEGEVKAEAAYVMKGLVKTGTKVMMLTGEQEETAGKAAREAGISDYRTGILPEKKYEFVTELEEKKKKGDIITYVGDNINDAPIIKTADVGIAMGGIGKDAAMEASDVVVMKDDLKGILNLKRIADRTMRIVTENLVGSIGIKAVVLVLSALGISSMWMSVFADVGVALLAVLNALRVGLYRKID